MKKLISLIICILFLTGCGAGCWIISAKSPRFQEILTRDISFKDDIKFISQGRFFKDIRSNEKMFYNFENPQFAALYFTDDAVIISELSRICDDNPYKLKLKEDYKILYSDITIYGTGVYEVGFFEGVGDKRTFPVLYLGDEKNQFSFKLDFFPSGVLKNTGAKADDALTSMAHLFEFLDPKIETKRITKMSF